MTELAHEPVLLQEVLTLWPTDPEGRYLDGTFGLGGHSLALLEKFPRARVLGLEADPWVVSAFRQDHPELPRNLTLKDANFRDAAQTLRREEFLPLAGALLDLGVGAFHYKASGRGFGFTGNEPLDMRLSPENPLPASRILNEWPADQIERVLKEYGEEPGARRIALEIVRRRTAKPWRTTGDLLELFGGPGGGSPRARGIHPATRTFLALRVAVNRELENLSEVLADLPGCLKPGGRLAVVAFHSLEDRIVKNAFRELVRASGFKAVTRSPVRPQPAEIRRNPRARSAKLRVVEKL